MIAIMALTLVGRQLLSEAAFARSSSSTSRSPEVSSQHERPAWTLHDAVAFSNGGNRDAALLRIEPALWGRRDTPNLRWVPIVGRVHADIPPTDPKVPTIIKAVEASRSSRWRRRSSCAASDVEEPWHCHSGSAFLGIRVATMNSGSEISTSSSILSLV